MFFELRQYHIKSGQRARWVQLMEEKIIPFQTAQGMSIMGSFVGQSDLDLYVWIRRFESEESRKQLYQAVYQSDYWKNEITPQIDEMLDRKTIQVTRLEATPQSSMQ